MGRGIEKKAPAGALYDLCGALQVAFKALRFLASEFFKVIASAVTGKRLAEGAEGNLNLK